MEPALVTGRYFEAPRWHDGRLWLVDSLARTLLTVDLDGRHDVVCELPDVPAGLGFLPTGEPVVTAMFQRRLLKYADGRTTEYADLTSVARGTIDDMIIDDAGRCFVGDLGFDLRRGVPADPRGGVVGVTSDGHVTALAGDLRFPNGIAVADDRLVVAESHGDSVAEFTIGGWLLDLPPALRPRRRAGRPLPRQRRRRVGRGLQGRRDGPPGSRGP